MAELVAGAFLSSSFQVIFDKLASVDIRYYFGGNKLDDLVKELDIKLNSINHVLEEAEIKQYQNTHVKKWLDELKHVLYDADQILDEIATDAMLNKMNAESEPVTNFISGMWSSLTPNPFESRINQVLENLQLLADQKKDLGLEDGPCASKEGLVSWKPSKTLSTTALVDESTIYGREVQKEELIKLLLEGNDSGNKVPIISIVGLGGMGKTTLAKLVCNDKKIKEHFQLQAWVYVSESFDVVGLTKAILESFKFSANGENLSLLHQQLQQELTGKKFLIVLDDIWNVNAACWEDLLLPFNHGSSGSKIIVTTREKKVGNVLNSKLFDLQQLDKSDCWRLFETHAFHGRNKCENPELESIGKKIVNKCGGLPLAVKTLGQLLRRKFSVPEWTKILETDMWRLPDGVNINPVLRLSYHNLPSNHKRCFAYCSIIPKGYEFGKGELIGYWMAEGLLKCCEAYNSEEEFGSEIFSDLESISFLQQSHHTKSFTQEHYFFMHDLVNDLAKSVSGEFCKKIDSAWVEGNLKCTRHIWCSLELNCVDKLLEQICEVKGLRSLILKGDNVMLISNNVQRDLFSRLTCLRMLSFRGYHGCGLSELVDEIGNLKLLRYLDLSDTRIKSLPDTICMLYNLQTLLLQWCELTELPSNFSKLINLRHLELPFGFKKMPKNIGKLNNLHTLNYFIVEEQNGSGIKELANMNNLHGTIKITGLGNVIDHVDAAKANLKDKKYLEELYMVFDGGREEMDDSIVESTVSVLEALEPNSNLKKLNIENYNGDNFPNWLRDCHLPNLVSLKLKRCRLCSQLPPFGQLPCLKYRSISHCDGIKIIGEEFYDSNSTSLSFRSLEVLEFYGMDNWEELSCLEGFPLLKELYIRECPELKRIPPQHLPSLQKFEIRGCNKLEECLCLEGSPLLKELYIRGCPDLKRIPPQHLPSLQKFEIRGCNKLEEWLCLEGSPLLKEVSIEKCSKLKRAPLPQHLPSLQKLIICDCEMLEASIPKGDSMIELVLDRCDRILVKELPTSLKKFVLYRNRYVEFSDEQNLVKCTVLERLAIDLRGFVKHPSLDLLCYNSLRNLEIKECHSSSLPFSLHLFTNLQSLYLYDCPQLESFPSGGLPSNLIQLNIENCPKLIGSREEWGLFQLNSLNVFSVKDAEFENVESFPEENLLPPTLVRLYLRNCSKLRIMNNKGFLHLNSLIELSIRNCPSLESLP
ncbi:putative disease resistance RPP13-like protein 1 [Trifolium pratense]|uniref:putative disease resistance RPP13-like protein 1 n=1 Tax=Trifolium pratense TaxID=57577 RepID=UPI001E692081|nr:putative disease resistance RPP13-like protein 1 [Trifolium pratense]XP_045819770.1 putative disease resistance RPP13-like protein 1 [Trifolium pratense]